MSKKTMVYRLVGPVFVVLHTEKPPEDDEWEAYTQATKKLLQTCRRTLVVSKGGGPNAKQRKYMNQVIGTNTNVTVAVVNDSTMVRGIVTALGWFNSLIKSFPYNDAGIQDAITYLKIDTKDAERVNVEIKKMKLDLAIT